jgi:hypothetical protein
LGNLGQVILRDIEESRDLGNRGPRWSRDQKHQETQGVIGVE